MKTQMGTKDGKNMQSATGHDGPKKDWYEGVKCTSEIPV